MQLPTGSLLHPDVRFVACANATSTFPLPSPLCLKQRLKACRVEIPPLASPPEVHFLMLGALRRNTFCVVVCMFNFDFNLVI